MTPRQKANFQRMMNPRHVAFVGGTDAVIAIGEARRRGYHGAYWPVNPKRETLAGLPCFASVRDLPEPPDAVFVAIPARQAIEAIKELSGMGAGGIVCYAAGFKEAGKDGEHLENALIEAVGDMAMIGPNCYGMINYLDNVALWPFAHGGYCPGYGAAIITQSGMFSSDISMSQRSLPLTFMVSAGNQAVMGLEDFIDIFSEHGETRAIGVHIEGLSDISKFEAAALKALANDTPIVALKTGKSKIGSALTVSHTGSLSGSNAFYEALFDRCGVISVDSPSQFLETLKYLCVVDRPKGRRIAGFTCSGGGATMMADHGEKISLEFPPFDKIATHKLRTLLPPIATVSNPLDYTTPIWGQPEITTQVFEAAIAAQKADATVLVQDYPAAGLDESKVYYANDAAAFGGAAKKLGVPAAICSTLPENLDQQTRETLITNGIAPMQGIHECLNAIKQASLWTQARDRILKFPLPALSKCANTVSDARYMNEAEGKAILSQAGIPVPNGRLVKGADVLATAEIIGYPVVLKMMSERILHKTDAGAVKVGIKDANDLRRALEAMKLSVSDYDPTALSDLFLVEEMAPSPLAELVVGLQRDPQFGLTLTLGSGGILVELLGDSKTLLLPTDERWIKEALRSLKLFSLLTGFRGQATANLEVVSSSIDALCRFAVNAPETPDLIEVNPFFIYQNSVLAVDALVCF